MRNLVNAAIFQVGWFACVLGAAAGHAWIGSVTVAAIVVLHVTVFAADRAAELRLVALVTVPGAALSLFNAWNDAVEFAPDPIAFGPLPLWIISLWALFATLPRHALGWMRGRLVLAALFGLIGSPLSYLGAERMGAVEINSDPWRGVVVLGVTWALAVPYVIAVAGPTPDAKN